MFKKILAVCNSATLISTFVGATQMFAQSDATMADAYVRTRSTELRNGLAGWNVMSDFYRNPNIMDGLSLEWDYFSVHDDAGKFTGVIAYLVADPKGVLGSSIYFKPGLMPSGGNIACYGKFATTNNKVADYENFGLNFNAGRDQRSFFAENKSNGYYGEMIPIKGINGEPDKLKLKGKTKNFKWDLDVSQMWAGVKSAQENAYPDYNILKNKTWMVGNDMSIIESVDSTLKQYWTVNMLWPTTKVKGEITDLSTGQTLKIDGHGYRENTFGRWAFVVGGWDFYYMSDIKKKVQWTLQTYHHDTDDLDYVDMDFLDNGNPKNVQFVAKKNELGWRHDDWDWCNEARQCRPVRTYVMCKNSEYTVEVDIEAGEDYVPLLSKVTPVTNAYQILAMFPQFKGTVYRTGTKEIVTTFSGIGGGEFSLAKSVFKSTDELCDIGMMYFGHPMPK